MSKNWKTESKTLRVEFHASKTKGLSMCWTKIEDFGGLSVGVYIDERSGRNLLTVIFYWDEDFNLMNASVRVECDSRYMKSKCSETFNLAKLHRMMPEYLGAIKDRIDQGEVEVTLIRQI
jgi:hypothetical protein